MQFQKKKQGGKKKKKKDKASGSSGSASGTSGSEAAKPASNQEQIEANLRQQPVESASQEASPQRKEGELEDISQTDTDHDAPSIHSEIGSPIHFEVIVNFKFLS